MSEIKIIHINVIKHSAMHRNCKARIDSLTEIFCILHIHVVSHTVYRKKYAVDVIG